MLLLIILIVINSHFYINIFIPLIILMVITYEIEIVIRYTNIKIYEIHFIH